MTGHDIASILKKIKGVVIKAVTALSVIVLVEGDRLDSMQTIAAKMNNIGAVVDSNLKGSSIGGIRVQDVKVLVKAAGRTGGLDVEAAAIKTLQTALISAMSDFGGPITIRTNGKTIKGICAVVKTNGTPKSDFHLADKNGKPLIHISHKKGSSPRDFQQWGGLTEDRIQNHKETQSFIAKCKAEYGSKIPSGASAYMPIKSKDLAMMSVFGVNFDKGSVDENRVDVLIQGDPGLKRISKGVYELTASGHIHYHGELPSGGFTPVLAVIYKGDRDQFGIKGARFSIYPMAGRTFKSKIK